MLDTGVLPAIAGDELQWGRPFYGAERQSRCARKTSTPMTSMGPPFLRGGEKEANVSSWRKQHDGLQWGRPFYRAERQVEQDRSGSLQKPASMGPPFLPGGEVDRGFEPHVTTAGFNGAALFTGRREIDRLRGMISRIQEIQWGRPFYGAERVPFRKETL